MAAATAAEPWTTACSPARMILPGARARTSNGPRCSAVPASGSMAGHWVRRCRCRINATTLPPRQFVTAIHPRTFHPRRGVDREPSIRAEVRRRREWIAPSGSRTFHSRPRQNRAAEKTVDAYTLLLRSSRDNCVVMQSTKGINTLSDFKA